jgi:hypothetical protein
MQISRSREVLLIATLYLNEKIIPRETWIARNHRTRRAARQLRPFQRAIKNRFVARRTKRFDVLQGNAMQTQRADLPDSATQKRMHAITA